MNDARAALETTFAAVLETQAFIFADPAAGPVPAPAGDIGSATIAFAGDVAGELAIFAPCHFCCAVAANMRGLEPDEDCAPAHAEDALREVLNVTCGNLVTALAGPAGQVNLSVPVFRVADTARWDACAARPGTVAFQADDWPVLLELSLADR